MSEHLGTLSLRMDCLENSAINSLKQIETIAPEIITSLQGLDYLRQSLQDLTTLVGLLSTHDTEASLTAAQREAYANSLKMAQTKALLWPDDTTGQITDARSSGDPLLF